MTTWTALTTLDARAEAEGLGAALERMDDAPTGVGVFEIEDGSGRWEVGAYFLGRPDDIALTVLAEAFGARPFAVSKLPDKDWVAEVRRELSPVRAGRFVVYGEHDAHRISSELIGLRIEAAMAFGTGHHATTQGVLSALGALARQGFAPRAMADVGCGTGVLAMAAAKLWRLRCVASDIDKVATDTARANARANQVAPFIRVVTCPGFQHEALREGPRFDLICANILARPLKRLAPDMARRAAPGGAVVLSGILDRQAKSVENSYRAWGFETVSRLTVGEWVTLTLSRAGR